MDDAGTAALASGASARRYPRRTILKRAAAIGFSSAFIPTLLAACGGGSAEEATPSDAAPGSPSPAPGETPSGETTGGIVNANTTLGDKGIGNPILNGNDYWTEWLVFSKLTKYDDEGNVLPDLAATYEYSEDGLTLTLSLVDTTWHDGEPFTAADVLFTFDTVSDPNVDTPYGSRLQVGGEKVQYEALDDRTVRITMKEPFAPFLFGLSQIGIIPRHLLENSADINTDPFNLQPIGTGPYKFVEKQPDQFVRYERFDNYFKGRPAADGWTVFYMVDANAGAAALESGEIDMMFTPPEMQPRYEDDPDYMLLNYVYFTPITLAFNHKHPALADINVRRAIAHAIDRKTLNETVTKGRGLLANNHYATTGPLDRYNNYDEVNYETEYPFDPARAQRLLDEAGWTPGADGIREKNGQRLSLTVLTYAGFDEYKNDQVIIQQMLGEVGIEITPQVLEYTTLEGMWHDPNDDPMGRAMEVQEWPHPFEQDPDVFNELHSSNVPPGDNYMWFQDAEVDQLIDQGRTTVDLDERIQIYQQLDRRRMETLPALPLYCAVDGWVVSRRLGGVPEDTPSFRWYQRAFPEKIYKQG
ncbi:ABC transporter substrate-binding protein [Sphaerobacter sp.]|uniref:ABC transporter substrate-binding protein n=1 Tax=Sphaerobacter sp. TaxID=2099654 RepID=UPI001E0BDB7D|nr:ABC transporter substrate-binding protein [Sphaerobacter sp.]MBX5446640.1 hypothetical protein [Sphaerobacter sp.]